MMIAASGIYQKKLAFIKPAPPLHNYLHFISLRSRKMATTVHWSQFSYLNIILLR